MSHVKDKDKNQILEELADTAQVGTQIHEQQKSALIVRCTEDIESSLNALKDQINGLMETIYRASQGMQDKYDSYSKSQSKQQKIIISLTLVIALSTAAYTWITWQSVSAMREANEIQKQMLTIELNSPKANNAHNNQIQPTQ